MLVGNAGDGPPEAVVWGVYYSLSDDLINWTPRRLLMEAELRWTYDCNTDEEPISTPTVLDPDSATRNFETTDQRVYLHFTRNWYNHFQGGCYGTFNRDLVRIPIEFSNQAPGGPSAALSVSSSNPTVRQLVSFDASGSKDANGQITGYRWDLDGDGRLETETGTDPTARTTYETPGKRTVRLQVSDDAGNRTDTTATLDVSGCRQKPGKGNAKHCKPPRR
jgi:PKD repeat protein